MEKLVEIILASEGKENLKIGLAAMNLQESYII